MYCKKCGAKNDSDAKFCTECGISLEENKEIIDTNEDSNKVHDSIVRKALKMSAKNKPKGPLCGMVGLQIVLTIALFFVIFLSIGVAAINGDFNAGSVLAVSGLIFLSIIVYFIISILISVGMMKTSLAISRDESVTFGGAVKGLFQDFNCSLKAIGGILLYSIGIGVLSIVPFVGGIAALILQVYILPVVVAFIYMALDTKFKDMSMGDLFHKSMDIVSGHRLEFYGLIFSFIGWMLLGVVTLGLLYIWLMPYMMLAMANWYRSLIDEVSYTEGEKGLSNIAVIGVSVVSYFAVIFVAVISLVIYVFSIGITSEDLEGDFNNFTERLTDDNYDYDDTKKEDKSLKDGKLINMSGINVYVPSDYTETTMASYEKIYKSPYGKIYIGTNSQDFSGSRDDFVKTLLNQYANMGFQCGTENVRKINNNEWVTFDCDYKTNTDVYLYITLNNSKLYYLIVTDAGDGSEGEKLLGNIERNLGLAY